MKKIQLTLVLLVTLALTSCQVWHLADTQAQKFDVENKTAGDSAILAIIQPYKVQLDAEMNEVLGNVETEMKKAQPESLLGNWMCDALLKKTADYLKLPVDFAIVNYGGVRIPSLSQGDLTRGKIFELMPFDNLLVAVRVDGDLTQRLFDVMAAKGGWPISQGVQYEIQDGKAVNVRINNQPLQAKATYTIVLSDYLLDGGDNCDFLGVGEVLEVNVLIRDALIEYVKETTAAGKNVTSSIEGRVKNL